MDYTRCDGKVWLYSQKTVDLVQEYVLKFPKIFEALNHQGRDQGDYLFESDLAADPQNADGDEAEDHSAKPLTQITRWLKEQPHTKALRRSVGSESLNHKTIQCVVEAVEKNKVC